MIENFEFMDAPAPDEESALDNSDEVDRPFDPYPAGRGLLGGAIDPLEAADLERKRRREDG